MGPVNKRFTMQGEERTGKIEPGVFEEVALPIKNCDRLRQEDFKVCRICRLRLYIEKKMVCTEKKMV
jgi:hypothetical protein